MGVRTSVSASGYLSSGLHISRRGACEEISGAYEKTSTNGKFLYHKPSELSCRCSPQFCPLLKKTLMCLKLFLSALALSAPEAFPPIFEMSSQLPVYSSSSFSSSSFALFPPLSRALVSIQNERDVAEF